MKLLVSVLLFFLSCGLYANSYENVKNIEDRRIYSSDYYAQLAYCNSLRTDFQRQMCRLGLFASY